MRNLFLVACIAVLFVSENFAQRGLELGAFFTPQSTWIFNLDDFEAGDELNFRPTWGTAYGLNVGFNFTDNVGIRSGIGFANVGQNYITGDDFIYPGHNWNNRLSYMRIPVLFKYNGSLDAPVAFLFNFGADLGFLNKATWSQDPLEVLGIQVYPEIKRDEITQNFNSFDLSAVLGMGGQVNISDYLNINFMVRLNYSIFDIDDASTKTDADAASNNFSAGLQLGVNYVLGF